MLAHALHRVLGAATDLVRGASRSWASRTPCPASS
jgi:hypothetical protein